MAAASSRLSDISRRRFLLGAFFLRAHGRTVERLAGIEFIHLSKGDSSRRFLRIHGNEETAREALERVMESTPGEAWIVTSKTRLVLVEGMQLDPNRIFSRGGAARNLRWLNPAAPPAVQAAVLDYLDRERPRLLGALTPPPGGLIVAVHNNGAGYSMETEAALSQAVHRPRPGAEREFFLATDPEDFRRIAAGPYNAVLQDDAPGEDDGSLSRLCAARRIRYVNLEAPHGRLETQTGMLRWLLATLP